MHVDLKKLNRLLHRRWAGVGTFAFNLAIIGLRLIVPYRKCSSSLAQRLANQSWAKQCADQRASTRLLWQEKYSCTRGVRACLYSQVPSSYLLPFARANSAF